MADPVSTHPAISVYFSVEVDGVDLGSWITCSGLGMEIDTQARGDSAMTFVMHHLPGHLKYSHLVLGRPVSPDTSKVMAWISAFHLLPVPTAAQVTALDPAGHTVISWQLFGVTPVKWTGPSFDAAQVQIAKEQLELAYMGFL
jgi:phage tail-like protein